MLLVEFYVVHNKTLLLFCFKRVVNPINRLFSQL